MKELDIKVEQEAIKKANNMIFEAMEENEKQKQAKKKEEELDDLIDEFAKILIEDNKRAIGEDIKNIAIEKIDNEKIKRTKEEGGMKDEQKTKTTRRKTTRTA